MTNELEQLTQLCRRLGAEPAQATTMAAQLLKRADQLALERGIERTAALGYLVELVMKGVAAVKRPRSSRRILHLLHHEVFSSSGTM